MIFLLLIILNVSFSENMLLNEIIIPTSNHSKVERREGALLVSMVFARRGWFSRLPFPVVISI